MTTVPQPLAAAIPFVADGAPAAPLARARVAAAGGATRGAWLALLVAVTVLQRFGINLGSYSLNLALPAMYALLIVAAATGRLQVAPPRLILFAVAAGLALASTLINDTRASGSSLLLLFAIYLPSIFVLAPEAGVTTEGVLRAFANIALFCAVAGIAQFYAQYVLRADWLFDFGGHVPTLLRGPQGFNTAIPMGALFKSNGFFFREPSGFSFIMALGLVAECLTHRRVWRIGCLGWALLLTYSGTGLLALALGTLLPPDRKTLLRAALIAAAGAVLFWLLGDALHLSFTLGRVAELDSERSSGYIRYIAPLRLLLDAARTDPASLWLGHGPGTIFHQQAAYEFHDPTWAKLVFEYGVLGFVAFVTLFVAGLRASVTPIRLRVMLFAGWLVMGGHLLSPEQNFLTFALVGLVPDPAARAGRA